MARIDVEHGYARHIYPVQHVPQGNIDYGWKPPGGSPPKSPGVQGVHTGLMQQAPVAKALALYKPKKRKGLLSRRRFYTPISTPEGEGAEEGAKTEQGQDQELSAADENFNDRRTETPHPYTRLPQFTEGFDLANGQGRMV